MWLKTINIFPHNKWSYCKIGRIYGDGHSFSFWVLMPKFMWVKHKIWWSWGLKEDRHDSKERIYHLSVKTYVIHLLGTYVTILCNWLIIKNYGFLYKGPTWILSHFSWSLSTPFVSSPSLTPLNHFKPLRHLIFGLKIIFFIWYNALSLINLEFHIFWPNFWGFWKFLRFFKIIVVFAKVLGLVMFKWS